jgi:hypothetical protein
MERKEGREKEGRERREREIWFLFLIYKYTITKSVLCPSALINHNNLLKGPISNTVSKKVD